MDTDLTAAFPFVVMRLQGELHLLESTLAEAQVALPALEAQVTATREEIDFLRDRIMELHAAIASLGD